MNKVLLPAGLRFENLSKGHSRKLFRSGQDQVDDWLAAKALQHQEKRLSVTKVLIDESKQIAGFYTLATGQVDFGDLPSELMRRLPKRALPVAILAWLGVDNSHQGQGLGRLLLAHALRNCHEAGKTFAFVAVVIDCLDSRTKEFYRQWEFGELPGNPFRLFLSAAKLDAMMKGTAE